MTRREEEVETDVVFGGTAVGTEATDSFLVQRLQRHKTQENKVMMGLV